MIQWRWCYCLCVLDVWWSAYDKWKPFLFSILFLFSNKMLRSRVTSISYFKFFYGWVFIFRVIKFLSLGCFFALLGRLRGWVYKVWIRERDYKIYHVAVKRLPLLTPESNQTHKSLLIWITCHFQLYFIWYMHWNFCMSHT